jgi:hypothetical protein
MNLHFPDFDPRNADREGCARMRGPVPAWMLVALIAAVLGGALIAASLTTDTRTYAERHLFVPTGARAL